ncbi:cysteine proteinase [Basidiobolus meristosporus CBS 931.73]|uniref:ubiquitinyl hydrolase 1 n=1 Tax=Basidiobolus meristosporus CBS 931.73 TaxID=1314790 RepID=A0A1Y1YAT1_9FUNG|nr:cysteine proteinase [Basidiobolus meristosporus CBS 931.73]|eukprot:ORX95117.1 cysteine proteinase [Basidiobolus meristosporus CBS 931.73]
MTSSTSSQSLPTQATSKKSRPKKMWHVLGLDPISKDFRHELKLAKVGAYLFEHGHPLPANDLERILRKCRWIVEDAIFFSNEYIKASDGILVDVNKNTQFKGPKNSLGTSCYIDSLLFAMFGTHTCYDSLLRVRELTSEAALHLQTTCRLYVNLLRSGKHVSKTVIEMIRNDLAQCGWKGGKSEDFGGSYETRPTQEDASELLLFLMDVFELPFLPLGVKLHHYGDTDEDDAKIITERIFQLSIPSEEEQEPSQSIMLENILVNYFYNNKVSGIRRNVEKLGREETIDAWSVMELLPFYSAENELGTNLLSHSTDFPEHNIIVPLTLKRYAVDHNGYSVRTSQHVSIPPLIDFSSFVSVQPGAPLAKYTLVLKSAVCHLGTSLSSGHYISYSVSVDDPTVWYKHDDLEFGSRRIRKYPTSKCFEDMAENGYLFFYQLVCLPLPLIPDQEAPSYSRHQTPPPQYDDLRKKAKESSCFLQ